MSRNPEIEFANDAEQRAFSRVLQLAVARPELIAEFDRLYGSSLGLVGVDESIASDLENGRFETDLSRFTAFVYAALWLRLPDETRNALIAAAREEAPA